MNGLRLLRHVMWFDLRARRRELALWALVLLAQAALLIIGPDPDPTAQYAISYDLGILIVRFGLTIVLAALLVQSDALVGTTAFWMSRPIPRAALAAAKLLSATVWLVVAPAAVTGVTLALIGMSPFDALQGAWTIGLEQAVILSMACMAAIVTANLGQLIVAGIAGVTLVSTYNGLLLPSLTLAWPSVGTTLTAYQPPVYITTVIVCGLAITLYQYLRLRAWHSVAFVAVAMLLATTLTRLWPAPGPIPDLGPVPPSVMNASAITLTSSTGAIVDDVAKLSDGKRTIERRLVLRVGATGQPDDVVLWPVYATSKLVFKDLELGWSGPPDPVGNIGSGSPGAENQPWHSIRLALGDVDIWMPREGWVAKVQVGQLAEDQYYRHTFVPATLNADITMVAVRYHVTAAVPLRTGARLRVSGRTATILGITSLNPGAGLQIRETFLDRRRAGDFEGGGFYVLRNASRRQALLVVPKWFKDLRATVGIAATGVVTQTGNILVEVPPELAAHFPVDSAWLKEAELVLVEPETLGLLTCPLHVNGIRFDVTPAPAPSSESQPGGVR